MGKDEEDVEDLIRSSLLEVYFSYSSIRLFFAC
jgi:hypothetical protein